MEEKKAKYRDTLFRAIFGREENKRWTLELYNAIMGRHYTNVDDLELTTLEDVISANVKNDLSILIDNRMTLIEQQSTMNPNMPLRGLLYFAELYKRRYHSSRIFSRRLIRLASPQYFVFYNGKDDGNERTELKLSDAFLKPAPSGFEWTAVMLNINRGRNKKLVEGCRPLREYCQYVNIVRDNIASGKSFLEATRTAVDYAIKHNFLDGYFETLLPEIENMGLDEFNMEEYGNVMYQDGVAQGLTQGRNEGLAQGAHSARVDAAKKFLKMGLPVAQISEGTGLLAEEIEKLR